ncbi:CAP domain-containing protein [Halolamina litorea]|uniref:CAP domain-containing protein n=1 Tax=Halolamina litorea TaxID=1515593 RepID=A0ABD6BQX8_9EURY|nr:CAP domain-containing protein [Halolamina litorea]
MVCFVVLAAGCAGVGPLPTPGDSGGRTATPAVPEEPTTPSSARYNVDVEEIENRIHEQMNERRVQNGLEPLTRNESLDAVARYKSWDMAQRDYFSHVGPNGTSHVDVRDRFRARCAYFGQNLHSQRFTSGDVYPYPQSELSDQEQIATDSVNSLMNSSGHRENALSPDYDSQGIGVFVDENGTVFVTQELCGSG